MVEQKKLVEELNTRQATTTEGIFFQEKYEELKSNFNLQSETLEQKDKVIEE